MKVYGIYKGCKYEGGYIMPTMFYNQEEARVELMKHVEDENSYWNKDEPSDSDMILKETSPVCFETSCDVICVKEFEVV
jgi:hypothetical protein